MPSEILDTIHRVWPRCQLHVDHPHRKEEPLDEDLIRSPQLQSLSIGILVKTVQEAPWSDLPKLSQLISQHPSLRVLRLRDLLTSTTLTADCVDGPIQFSFSSGVNLPALEELTITHMYHADKEHVELWKERMDWSKLRHLNLGSGPAGDLVAGITGLVPQLKSLAIEINRLPMERGLEKVALETMLSFIKSIRALEEISMYAPFLDDVEEYWLVILQQHGHSLRRLTIDWNHLSVRRGWRHERVQQLLVQAPMLEDLSLELALQPSTARSHLVSPLSRQ
jgi:hypothetical protein